MQLAYPPPADRDRRRPHGRGFRSSSLNRDDFPAPARHPGATAPCRGRPEAPPAPTTRGAMRGRRRPSAAQPRGGASRRARLPRHRCMAACTHRSRSHPLESRPRTPALRQSTGSGKDSSALRESVPAFGEVTLDPRDAHLILRSASPVFDVAKSVCAWRAAHPTRGPAAAARDGGGDPRHFVRAVRSRVDVRHQGAHAVGVRFADRHGVTAPAGLARAELARRRTPRAPAALAIFAQGAVLLRG